MSAFSNPTYSKFGPIYGIPRVKCNVNGEQRKSERCIIKHSRNIFGILSIWIYPKIQYTYYKLNYITLFQ